LIEFTFYINVFPRQVLPHNGAAALTVKGLYLQASPQAEEPAPRSFLLSYADHHPKLCNASRRAGRHYIHYPNSWALISFSSLSIAGNYGRIYIAGPVFRAERLSVLGKGIPLPIYASHEREQTIVTSLRLVKERMDICACIVKWMREHAPAVDGNSGAEILGALQAAGFDVDDLACRRALRYLTLTRVVEKGPQGRGYLLRSRP